MKNTFLDHKLGAMDAERAWKDACKAWMNKMPSPHTRLAYQQAWQQLVAHSGVQPWEISREHILDWTKAMQRSVARVTIRQRLGAVSSFYSHTQTPGSPNPAARIPLPRDAAPLHLSQAGRESFLNAIPTHTLNGKRDRALFLCYMTTRRRTSLVRLLRRRNFVRFGSEAWLQFGTGESMRLSSCSEPLQQALQLYLESCGSARLSADAGLAPDDYLFSDCRGGKPGGRPLSLATVCHLVKKYARLAGLDPRITVHTLRYPSSS
jgi:site-specific recombinase XerD